MNLARALRVARNIPGHTEADVRLARDTLSGHIMMRRLRFPTWTDDPDAFDRAFDRTDDYLNALDGVAA